MPRCSRPRRRSSACRSGWSGSWARTPCGKHLADRLVAGGLLQREHRVRRAAAAACRRAFETLARRTLTIAGHVRPTVPHAPGPGRSAACRVRRVGELAELTRHEVRHALADV